MNKRIKTYEDLVGEQQRLASILKNQEVLIREDLVGVRKALKPLNKAFDIIGKMTTRDNKPGPVMNFGIEFGIDLFIRKFLLAKAGWFTKIVIPFLIKNYSSHIIGTEKRAMILQKIKNMFDKIRPKPEPQPRTASAAPDAAD